MRPLWGRPAAILCYHHGDAAGLERHLRYLAPRYALAPLGALAERVLAGRVPQDKPLLALTFDDGYRDVLIDALPVLQRWGAPATAFVVSRAVGAHQRFWWDTLEYAFGRTQAAGVWLAGRSWPLSGPPQRAAACRRAIALAKRLPARDFHAYLADVQRQLAVCGPDPRPGNALLTWDDVRALHRGGVAIGSHTARHMLLSQLEPAAAATELEESRATIEAELDDAVDAVAYPNGGAQDVPATAVTAAALAGYRWGVTTLAVPPSPGDDPLLLPRFVVDAAAPVWKVALRLSAAWRVLSPAVALRHAPV